MRSYILYSLVFGAVLIAAYGISEYWASKIYPQSQQPNNIGAPFSLVTHTGMAITQDAFKKSPSVVFFGFTHCPEICPTTLNDLSHLHDRLAQEGGDFQIFFITLDPVRDTVELLGAYIPYFGPAITGITGPEDEVHALAKAWGIFWQKSNITDQGYSIDHTATVFMLDKQGQFKGTIDYHESQDIAYLKLKRLTGLN